MFLIALTGGIASGKSLVSSRLAEHGAVVVDADILAREVVAPGTPGPAAIAEHFGPGVIAADGTLNRPALGAIIFSNDHERQALNDITHPAVWLRAKELFAQAEAADPNTVIVYDVPLLVEASSQAGYHAFDLIVVVQAAPETRIRRLIELRGLSRDEAVHRLNSQASDAERLALADVVIDTDGSLEHTLEQTDSLWDRLVAAEAARG